MLNTLNDTREYKVGRYLRLVSNLQIRKKYIQKESNNTESLKTNIKIRI
jgi:hypothetical protein